MKLMKLMFVFMVITVLLVPFSMASAEGVFGGIDIGDIEITIDGVPLEEMFDAAAGMFTDSLKENVGDAVDELSGIFGDLADSFSSDIKDMEYFIKSMLADKWQLNIPSVSLDIEVRRGGSENALEIYDDLEKDADFGRLAMRTHAGCSHNLVYVYDENGAAYSIIEALRDESFYGAEAQFGLPDDIYTYEMIAAFYVEPSDDERAVCNLYDLSEEDVFDIYAQAVRNDRIDDSDDEPAFGDEILTVVFVNPDDEWLAVAARGIGH